MTYLDLIRDADRKLDNGDITLGEYEKMIKPLNREIQPDRNRPPHWIISSDGYYPYCSECKSEPKNGEMTDFCPNCGADMRPKNDESGSSTCINGEKMHVRTTDECNEIIQEMFDHWDDLPDGMEAEL